MNNSNKIYISCFASKEVIQVDASTGLVEARIPVSKFPYAVLVDKSSIQVANFWRNTPDYLFEVDNKPHQFYLTDPVLVTRNVVSYTNTIVVQDVSEPTYASIPNIHSASIFKNGIDVGLKTTVVEGDQLKLRYTTPSTYSTRIQIPLYVGSTYDWFVSETRPIDNIIDPYYFNDVFDAELNSEYISNEIEITAIDIEARVVFNVDQGTIILNGVDSGLSSILVQLGDKIRVRLNSASDYCGRQFIITNCAGYTNVWSIINKKNIARDTKYVLNESNKDLFALVDQSKKESKNYLERIQEDSITTTINLDATPLGDGISGDVFYVADYINSRIIKVDLSDGVEEVFNVAPNKPFKVAWKDDNVFYTCPDTNLVSSLDGTITFSVDEPRAILFNSEGQLAVSGNNSITIFANNEESNQYELKYVINAPNTTLYDLDVSTIYTKREDVVAKFDSTQSIQVNHNNNFNFGMQTWTVECYVKIFEEQTGDIILLAKTDPENIEESSYFFYLKENSDRTYHVGCDLYSTLTNQQALTNGNVIVTRAKAIVTDKSISLQRDTWYHIAFVRAGNAIRFFVNGTLHLPNIQFSHKITQALDTNFDGLIDTISIVHETNYSFNQFLPNDTILYNRLNFSIYSKNTNIYIGTDNPINPSFKGLISNIRINRSGDIYVTNVEESFDTLQDIPQTVLLLLSNTSSIDDQSSIGVSTFSIGQFNYIPGLYYENYDHTYYATDIKNNKIHEILDDFSTINAISKSTNVGKLPYSLALGQSHVYVSNFGDSSFSTISLNDFTSNKTQLPDGFSMPTAIEIDGDRLLITPYREPYVLEYKNDVFDEILLTSNALDMGKVNDTVWIIEQYGELLDNSNTGIADYINPIVIPDQLNALFDTFYESEEQSITGQTYKPITLYLEPYADASIIKNGIDVGKIANFVVGDKFKIKAKSISFFKKPKTVGLYSCQFQTSFTIITVADLQPDIMIFDAYVDAIPRSRIYSQELPITGIDANEDLPIEIFAYSESLTDLIEPQLIVNGEYTMSNTATVRLGDTIGFSVLVKGVAWNGGKLSVKIKTITGFEFAFFDVYTAYLEGPIHETKPLDKKEPAEYFDNITYTHINDFDFEFDTTRKYQNFVFDLNTERLGFNGKEVVDFDLEVISRYFLADVSTDFESNKNYTINEFSSEQELSSNYRTVSVSTNTILSKLQDKPFVFSDYEQFRLHKILSTQNTFTLNYHPTKSVVDSTIQKSFFATKSHVNFNYLNQYAPTTYYFDAEYENNDTRSRFIQSSTYATIDAPSQFIQSSTYATIDAPKSFSLFNSYELNETRGQSIHSLSYYVNNQTKDFIIESSYNVNFNPRKENLQLSFEITKADNVLKFNSLYDKVVNKPYHLSYPSYLVFYNNYAHILSEWEYRSVYSFVIDGVKYDVLPNSKHLLNLEYERNVLIISQFMLGATKQAYHTDTFEYGLLKNTSSQKFSYPEYEFSRFLGKEIPQTYIQYSSINRFIENNYIHRDVLTRFIDTFIIAKTTGSIFLDSIVIQRLTGTKYINSTFIHRDVLTRFIDSSGVITNSSLVKFLSSIVEISREGKLLLSKDVELNHSLSKNIEREIYLQRRTDVFIDSVDSQELTVEVARTSGIFLSSITISRNINNRPEISFGFSVNSLTSKDHKLSIEEKRVFATEGDAIAAAAALGYTINVKVHRLEDGTYYWHVPSKIINSFCAPATTDKVYPVGWYVHGG